MLAIDIGGSVIYANQRMEQLLQLSVQDIVGSNIEAYIASESIDGFRKMIRAAIEPRGQSSKHKASFGTDATDNAAPAAKRAKFSDDQAVVSESKPAAVYTANFEAKEDESNLPTQKIRRHVGFNPSQKVSASATSSSQTGEQKQSTNSSSRDYKITKVKGANDSCSSESNSSDAVKDARSNVALPPTFVICLLRKNNSKVWCELTISARVKSVSDYFDTDNIVEDSSSDSSPKQPEVSDDMLELLLCFRPVTQGLPDSDLTSSSNSGENGSGDSNGSNGKEVKKSEN